jgi:hypothetical protein
MAIDPNPDDSEESENRQSEDRPGESPHPDHRCDGCDAHRGDRVADRLHHGALVFGIALLVVRLIHVGKFLVWSSRDGAELHAGTRRMTPCFVAAPALIVLAAFVESPYRELLWIMAAVIDYGAPLIAGVSGFRVVPSYFVARDGSIIIIALGEAIVELGAGAAEHIRRPGVITALVLGVLISACLWWTSYRWRDHHQLTIDRLITAAAALLVLPVATTVAALVSMTTLTVIGVLRLACELWRRPRVGPAIAGTVR